MKTKSDIKILLLQIRRDPNVKLEELQSFARYAKLDVSQISTFDVFKNSHFSEEIINGYDALFVGGASEASVLEPDNYPFIDSIKNLLSKCIEINLPVFASCFGFQAAILAFGGEIFRDVENFEMGTYPMTLTDKAQLDPIFKHTSNHFMAVSVHQEKAIELPENCELLAYTKDCIHSFRYKDKPFWAFQFHPELDRACLTERLGAYKEKYTEDKEHFEKVIESLVDTPESNNLVNNFLNHLMTLI